MNLQPRYKSSAELTGLATGAIKFNPLPTEARAALATFFKGDKGDKGDKGETGDVSTAPINGGFF